MIKKIHDELKKNKEDMGKKGIEQRQAKDLTFHKNRLLMELFRDAGSAKLPACVEFIKDRLEGGEGKFIVFGHHVDVLDGVCHYLVQHKVRHIRIDGSTPSIKRSGLVNLFQEEEDVRVAVLSMTAAGSGITLTKANTVIFAELFWNPGQLRQCEDRAHRIGQRSNVNVLYLVAKSTIDEFLWGLISHKLEVLGETLDGQQDKLDVHSSTDAEVDPNLSQADAFMEYLLEKVDSYDERKEKMEHRRLLREAKRRNEELCYDTNESNLITSPPPNKRQKLIPRDTTPVIVDISSPNIGQNTNRVENTPTEDVLNFKLEELPKSTFKNKLAQFKFGQ